jgi:hypothetical protein
MLARTRFRPSVSALTRTFDEGPPGGVLGNIVGRALVATDRPRRVRCEEPGLVREHDCLNAVAEVELLEDVCDVR